MKKLGGRAGIPALWVLPALVAAALLVLPAWTSPVYASTRIMGTSAVTAEELAEWFATTGVQPDLPISILELARHFIREGAAEGVRGDLAFAQSVLETGHFTFPAHGQVRPWHNNYAGLGAVDGGNNPNTFPTPQIGVRAQIQHLRAYADPTVTESNLANPLVSPRFHLVSPKGRARTWEELGGLAADGRVNWATDPDYGTKILTIFGRITRYVEFHRQSIAIAGDWNGDGTVTPGWYRSGRVYLRNSNSAGGPDIVFNYGRAGDTPVVGDWNGDGQDSVGIIRDRTWHLRFTNSSGPADRSFIFGRLTGGDYALSGDWNGDGKDTVGIVRGGEWHLRDALAGGAADRVFVYGRVRQGDVPVTGDWNGDGSDTPGIVRGNVWHLRNTNRGGPADWTVTYGRRGDTPVTGDWNGDGNTTPGLVRGAVWYLRNELAGGAANTSFVYTGW